MNLWTERLRPRERQVLQLAAEGYMNKEIAARLGISPWTVRNHMTEIYSSLNIAGHEGRSTDRTRLVVFAIKFELVDVAAVYAEVDRRKTQRPHWYRGYNDRWCMEATDEMDTQ